MNDGSCTTGASINDGSCTTGEVNTGLSVSMNDGKCTTGASMNDGSCARGEGDIGREWCGCNEDRSEGEGDDDREFIDDAETDAHSSRSGMSYSRLLSADSN